MEAALAIQESQSPDRKEEYGVIEFLNLFTEEYCEEYLYNFRYANEGIFCPYCGTDNPYTTNRGYKCSSKRCYKKFTLYSNTIFHGSKIPLREWFFAMYQISSNKKNLSSVQLAKNLGMTQKTVWNILNKIRQCLSQDDVKLSGTIEIDEAFISKGDFHRYGDRYIRKNPVLGLIERGGVVVLVSMLNRKRVSIEPIVNKYVEEGSTVYTDCFVGYRQLNKKYYHDSVNHRDKEFVRGDVHTNTIEGVWAFFKRNVKNPHHQISNKHLQSYLNEGAFKYNNRYKTQMEKFDMILSRCIWG